MTVRGSSSSQPSEVPSDVRRSRAHIRPRSNLQSPRQRKIQSARESSERFQRMEELWGSPEGWEGKVADSSASGSQSRKSNVSSLQKHGVNQQLLRVGDGAQSKSFRMMSSPPTPSLSTVSFIPVIASPSVAMDVLKAAHANMSSDISNISLLSSRISDGAGAHIKSLNADAFSSPGQQLQEASTAGSNQSKNAAPRTRAPSCSPRRSDEILSSEEQELKVHFAFDVSLC
jgi:hypothetical protein